MYESPKRRRHRASRAEQRICEALGARPTYNSGAGSEKGDGRRYGAYRIEAKSTLTKSYRLTAADWHKLASGCVHAGEMPVFSIEFERRCVHLLVVGAGFFDSEFSYEGLRDQKGVGLSAEGWATHGGDEHHPYRLILLRHNTALYHLVAMAAEDLLPQLEIE